MRGVRWFALIAALFVATIVSQASYAAKTRTVAITVTSKGFVPAEVTVPRGKPVTLVVTRTTDRTCVKEFVMDAKHIRKALPLNEAVEVTFTPQKRGELRFACGMDMVAGKVVVR